MPEAAEVEIVRRGLLPVVGQRLERLRATEKLAIHGQEDEVIGRRLQSIERRGKLLGFYFDDQVVTCHLRMTGRWVSGEDPAARAVLGFEQQTLSFLDPRGFATMGLSDPFHWADGLGPDLFGLPDRWIPSEKERGRGRAIKAALLDQSLVAGIGNYLADEALWDNRIHPGQSGSDLSAEQWAGLFTSARQLAENALAAGGTTFRDFRDAEGERGEGQALLLVYGQAGRPCARCQTELIKGRYAGRGSTWCPSCQIS